jgi:hypothetical protein
MKMSGELLEFISGEGWGCGFLFVGFHDSRQAHGINSKKFFIEVHRELLSSWSGVGLQNSWVLLKGRR